VAAAGRAADEVTESLRNDTISIEDAAEATRRMDEANQRMSNLADNEVELLRISEYGRSIAHLPDDEIVEARVPTALRPFPRQRP